MSIEHVDDLRGMLDSEVLAEIAALRADRDALADRVRALEAAGERMAGPSRGLTINACRICRATWPIAGPERHQHVEYDVPCPGEAWRALVPPPATGAEGQSDGR